MVPLPQPETMLPVLGRVEDTERPGKPRGTTGVHEGVKEKEVGGGMEVTKGKIERI